MARTFTSLSRLGGLAALAMLSVAAGEPDARACGGCFHGPPLPQQTVTVINDHRMVFSISPAQTVLWDQIEYRGQASEFAWVLPVKPGARIELSQDAWIASLEASTQTVIQAPPNNCGVQQSQDVGGPPSSGCMGSTASAEAAGAGGGFADSGISEDAASPVQVITQQVVGPYDSVTVRASQGDALNAWLQANGYDIPASVQPVIDAFTTEGFDFIALKLAPGQGVQAMQPVRVVTPGADMSLPLRMVAAGVGAHVGLELFVLSEGAYQPQNFPLATIDFSQLKWDPNNVISNYTTLAAQALAANGGRGWLVETSGPANLGGGFSQGGNPPLDTTYQQTCVTQTLAPPATCSADAGPGDGAVQPTTEGGTSDGGSPVGDGGGGATEGGSPVNDAGADAAACQPTIVGCDDLDVAMTGITAGNLWITRLRADLPAAALSDDIVLQASPSQDPVPSFHQATQYTIANYDPCSGQNQSSSSSQRPSAGACACRTTDAAPVGTRDLALLAVAGLGAVLSVRRRRRV
jgi:MYXO-CTERM domain-containing protein